jgi:RHS repeat-associated protein
MRRNTAVDLLLGRTWSRAGCLLALALAAHVAQAQTVVRESEFAYDAVTGQLTLERIQPGTPECLETIYGLDQYGNRERVTARPCGDVANERVTRFTFDAHAGPGSLGTVPQGAYERTATNALGHAETKQYDPRWGAVATHVGPNGLQTQWLFDAFGRPVYQRHTDGTWTLTSYVNCVGNSPPAGCLRESAFDSISVAYASRRLPGGQWQATIALPLISAYYIETTPIATKGATMGARSQVHFDALGREIAKLTEGYDGRWVRTAVAYDAIGLKAAEYGPHWVASDPAGSDRRAYRTWTARRDLMHRPTASSHAIDTDGNGNGGSVVTVNTEYHGLEIRATDALNRQSVRRSNPGGQVAQTVDAFGATINLAYDGIGNLVRTRDALGNEVSVQYDARGQKIALNDPDKGYWTYGYNAFGELVSQVSPNDRAAGAGQQVTLRYDKLGRLIERRERTQNAIWTYDNCTTGIGKLCSTSNDVGFQRRLSYDNRGRPWQTEVTLGGMAYTSSVTFDDTTGRVLTQTYPTGLTVRYGYHAVSGVLNRIGNNATNAAYWSLDDTGAYPFDPRGNLVRQRFGNGVQSWHEYDRASGRARHLRAGADQSYAVMQQAYSYDSVGNLLARTDASTGLVEAFAYDRIDRLTRHSVQSVSTLAADATVTVDYNAIGNILWKSDVGAYTYTPSGAGAVRPHAVQTAYGTTYIYDANGNLERSTGALNRQHVWASFDLPLSMGMNGRSMAWKYSSERQRVESVVTDGALTRRIHYLHPDNAGGLFFEREQRSGSENSIENRHYLSAGGMVIGVVKTYGERNGTVAGDPNHINYWHKDHLGSIVVVSNGAGAVLERMAFDAWGKRLNPNGLADARGQLNPAHGDRGYTGHEHLDEIGLVHMNGRIYDPLLGRFLSPDPVIQAEELLQNYNRYSYVLNNPLRYTDPSGEFWQIVAFIVGAALQASNNNNLRIVGQVMMMAALSTPGGLIEVGLGTNTATLCGAPSIFNAGGIGNAALSAGTSSLIASRGDIGEAAKAAAFSMAFHVVGIQSWDSLSIERLTAHAVLGCAQAASSGGQCGPGAMSAFAGKLGSAALEGQDFGVNLVGSAIVGGTASVLGGGKFGNGALTASFGHLFNYCSSAGNCTTAIEQFFYDWWPGYSLGTCLNNGDCSASQWLGGVVDALPQGRGAKVLHAGGEALTSRAARREAMRDAGIPTSQQPVSQSRNASGREYSYDVPAPGGGTQRMSVQQQTMDRSHPGQAHWEAGRVKTDPRTGAVRENNYGRPALTNDKSKVDY